MLHPYHRHWLLVGLAVLAAIGQLLLADPAKSTEVFKCTARSGQVEFTDAPCGTNRTTAVVDARPNSLDNSAVREQLLKIENRALQEKLAAAQAASASSATPATPPAAGGIAACRTAQRDLEFAATSVEKNRALIRARQSAMYAACGIREPDREVTNIHVGQRGDRLHRPPGEPGRPRP
jgi:hypothetical protein